MTTRGTILRWLCLLTAVANCAGNAAILVLYRPIFELLGVPKVTDLHLFSFVSALSFTMGVGAFFVFLNPARNLDLLKTGIVGKGLYAFFTYYFFVFHHIHWFFLIFGVWDFVFVIVFFLYLMHLASPDLAQLQRGDVFAGLRRPRTGQALVIGFSLTGNGSKAIERLKKGLMKHEYQVDVKYVEPLEPVFRFPMSFPAFCRIIIRAAFRRPARIAPLELDKTRGYDLIVVESQTWMLGMAAPVEAAFQDPDLLALLHGRDAAALVVCRGARRRTLAQLVRWLESCRSNVVGGRGYVHQGGEPSRLLSLWFYLIWRREGEPRWLDGLVQKHYGLSEESLAEVERFGEDLAQRVEEQIA